MSIRYVQKTKVQKKIGEYSMALYVIGDFLREIRIRKGYTQEEVSFGICTPASLSRIENGTQMPGRLILEKLLERLGTENNLFNVFVSRDEIELYTAIQELIRYVTDEDMDKLEEQIAKVEKLTEGSSELEQQSLLWAKGKLAAQKYKDNSAAMKLFMKAIHITLPDFDGRTPLRNHLLTFDEITIINSIAVRYAQNGEYMSAIKLNMWLKDYMESRIVDGKMKTAKYPMILYNLSNWFGEEACHKEALKMADEGIDFCIKYGNLVIFPALILNKGVALIEMGQQADGEEYLHQAITIYKAMKKSEKVKLIMEWCVTRCIEDN